MAWKWNQVAHNTWSDKVTFELEEIRARIESLESQLQGISVGTTDATPSGLGEYGEDTFPLGPVELKESDDSSSDAMNISELRIELFFLRRAMFSLKHETNKHDLQLMHIEEKILEVTRLIQMLVMAVSIVATDPLKPQDLILVGMLSITAGVTLVELGGGQ